jgi:hypothetical protein
LLGSKVTVDNIGVVTRRIKSLKAAANENDDLRFFGSIHFQYACDVGTEIEWWVANETIKAFDKNWESF